MDSKSLSVIGIVGLIAGLGLLAACSPPEENVTDDPCDDVDCSDHGICEVRDDEAVCLCESGYHADGLECIEDPVGCDDSTCNGHGTCDDSSGAAVCTCDEGYAGDYCDECAEGYHQESAGSGGLGDCVPDDDPCDPDPCDGYDCGAGTCACVAGEAVCSCEVGYTGEHCDECDDDYYELDADSGCVPCNELLFTFEATDASAVWLTGSFTGWARSLAAGAIEMTDDGTGLWSVVTAIEPGGAHEYKYILNADPSNSDNWQHDPTQPTVTTPEGYTNNTIDVCVFSGHGSCGDIEVGDWRDVVMYFVMVDRFFDSDDSNDPVDGASGGPADGASGQYMGGDLAGVTDQIGYLNDLGVTAIWLSAPYDNRDIAGEAINPAADSHMYSGYHGYWPSPANINYSDPSNPSPTPLVESRIGDEADLREFVDTAHATMGANGEGIRVLFDYVMNHVDIESGLYQNNQTWFAEDEYEEFVICGECNSHLGCGCDDQPSCWDHDPWGTLCAFTNYLPPFDFREAGARDWSVADALWWAIEYGIDGYRLDAIKHVPFEWLTELRDALDERISDPWGDRFYLVGETFAYTRPDLIREYVDPDEMLDGQFDFPFKYEACRALFSHEQGLDAFSTWMNGNDVYYGADAIMTTWIGNHDIPRAIHFASGQIGNCMEGSSPGNGWDASSYSQPTDAAPYERLGLAFAVMMTSRGIPLIYYGDEIGLAGGGDPDNRRMMVFDDGDLNSHQIALRQRVTDLANIRAENPALTRGTRTTHSVDADTWVYTMGGCGDTADVTVVINRADSNRTVAVPAGSYTDLIADGASTGGSTEMAPRSFLVLLHGE